MLLRIYYVRDFPPHTLPLEIRKGYFMEPENKFATAEEKEEEEERGDGREGGRDRSSQYQVVSKQRERDLRGAGQIFKKKMIASRFFFPFSLTPSAMFQIRAWSFFRKCVALMHFKSPFSKHNGISP